MKKGFNWTSGVGVGQKHPTLKPTPIPSVLRNPTPTALFPVKQ